MKALIEKMRKVADLIAIEKPRLRFLGLVHRTGAPLGWDVVIAADPLAPRTADALDYVAKRLKKVMKVSELVQISRIVVLPRNHHVIKELTRDNELKPGQLSPVFPPDRFDQAVMIWPDQGSQKKTKDVRAKAHSA
jgi:hypothetical protein